MTSRRGRRPGSPDTRAEILAAARELFAAGGFASTSVRAVAGRAGVDPALVHHYFGSKDDLFLAALQVSVDPRVVMARVVEGDRAGVGERLVRALLEVWGTEETRTPLLGLVRGVIDPAGAQLVGDAVFGLVLAPLGAGLELDHPERRLTLVASQLTGLILLRYVVQAPPAVAMGPDELVAWLAPTVQRYLFDDLPG